MTSANCDDYVGQLWDLLDGRLPDAARAELQAHLDSCESCAAELDIVRTVQSGLESIGCDASPPMPETVGRYRILRRLGAGGMGMVYEAEQQSPNRRVAVKVMRPDGVDNETWLRAFRRETEALGRLRHPSIATVYDAGRTDDGQLYLVMELVDGEPFDCRSQSGERRRRIAQLAEIAEAVDYAHRQGVVHRDLKPANVLVERDGTPRILDFGLARFLDPGLDVTRRLTATAVGSVSGTLPYICPEYLLGETDDPGVQSDVYALGVMLFELLAGLYPYAIDTRGGFPPAQRLVASSEPLSLRSIDKTMPRELVDITAKAIAKDPRQRYASAADLADDLRRFLAGQPVSAHPPSVVYRLHKFARRRRPALFTTAAIVAATITVWSFWPDSGPGATYVTKQFSFPDTVDFSPYPLEIDFDRSGRFAVHHFDAKDGSGSGIAIWDRSLATSERIDPPEWRSWRFFFPKFGPEGRRIAMLGLLPKKQRRGVFVLDREAGTCRQLVEFTGDRPDFRQKKIQDLCWSATGDRITFLTREPALYDLDLERRRTRWPTVTTGAWELSEYSRDGRWLLFVAQGKNQPSRDVWVIRSGGDGAAQRLTTLAGPEKAPRFAPDGRSVWFIGSRSGSNGKNVFRVPFDPETGQPAGPAEPVTSFENAGLRHLAFINDGHDLVFHRSNEESHVWVSTTGGKARPLVRGQTPTPAPDGSAVFYVANDHGGLYRLPLHDGATPVQVLDLSAEDLHLRSYQVNRSGEAIVLGGRDDDGFGVFRVDLRSPDGSEAKITRIALTAAPVDPRWSPNGAAIAFAAGTEFSIFDVATGSVRQLEAPSSVWGWETWTIRWAPDGRSLLAVGYEDLAEKEAGRNGLFLISYPEGGLRRIVPRDEPYKEGAEWHPSGEFITYCSLGQDHELRLAFPDGRSTRQFFDDADHAEYVGKWTPDGRQFVYGCANASCSVLHVREAVSGANGDSVSGSAAERSYLGKLSGHPFDGSTPFWSEDGNTAVWTKASNTKHFETLIGVR